MVSGIASWRASERAGTGAFSLPVAPAKNISNPTLLPFACLPSSRLRHASAARHFDPDWHTVLAFPDASRPASHRISIVSRAYKRSTFPTDPRAALLTANSDSRHRCLMKNTTHDRRPAALCQIQPDKVGQVVHCVLTMTVNLQSWRDKLTSIRRQLCDSHDDQARERRPSDRA